MPTLTTPPQNKPTHQTNRYSPGNTSNQRNSPCHGFCKCALAGAELLSTWFVLLYILYINKRGCFLFNLYSAKAHKNHLFLLCKCCKNIVLIFAAAITLLIFLGQIVPPSKIYLQHTPTNPTASNKTSKMS